MKKGLVIFLAIIGLGMIGGGAYITYNSKETPKKPNPSGQQEETQYKITPTTGNFNADIIRAVNNNENGNYLISPYSIEIALAMLKEGASGTTLTELNKVVPTRTIKTLSVKDRISVANALFIKDTYKDKVKKTFSDALTNKYSSEILYDKFTKPDVINNWVKNKTYGMIDKVIDNIDSNFVLGLANALAIDVEWLSQFDCLNTKSADFTVGTTVKKVEMMHNTYTVGKYIKTNDEIGIVIPYASYKADGTKVYESGKDTTDLEFIAVLPVKDVNAYVSEMTKDKLNKLVTNTIDIKSNEEVNLSIPRFEYDYDFSTFKEALSNIGLSTAFSPTPDYSKMIDPSVAKLYVGTAKHKTHISLNEKGTKAAAITYFGMETMGIPEQKQTIEINLNKPFVYMIRDTKSGELLFFGVVKQPNEWKASTCSSTK